VRNAIFSRHKRRWSFEVVREFPDGLKLALDLTDYIGFRLFERGVWDPATLGAVTRLLKNGGVFVDLGAHCGYFAVSVARQLGERVRVLAFEPNETVAALARRNVELNGLRNVTIDQRAVAASSGAATFYVESNGNSGQSGLVKRFGANKALTVSTVTLREALRQFGADRIAVLKMDIEGAEALVLPTLKSDFRAGTIDAMVLELHVTSIPLYGGNVRELVDLLAEDFDLFEYEGGQLVELDPARFPAPGSMNVSVVATRRLPAAARSSA
jgi:FkbM family methyltransferase